ncbi:hypothetical protein PFISCL1PPCAC_16904, partial [Pristionchus fissidentatus]
EILAQHARLPCRSQAEQYSDLEQWSTQNCRFRSFRAWLGHRNRLAIDYNWNSMVHVSGEAAWRWAVQLCLVRKGRCMGIRHNSTRNDHTPLTEGQRESTILYSFIARTWSRSSLKLHEIGLPRPERPSELR